jgi:monovalent cation:H+ antiporter-2, CPA2 family
MARPSSWKVRSHDRPTDLISHAIAPMPHETALLATIAAALGLALVFGFAAIRLGLPPLVGYLAAGIVVGPFTPGYVADTGLASQLAEVGVILLMFGVGLHFSVRDLLAVRRIAVPGALVRIILVTMLAAIPARVWGWPWGGALVFGLSLSVASTVVLLKTFEAGGLLGSLDGRIAVGWLIVEDLAMVLALVLLPALAVPLGGHVAGAAPGGGGSLFLSLGVTLLKVAAFVALMLFIGTRVVPWMLAAVARTGSRELFTLAVLACALCIAFGAAELFGVSFALGAFFGGVVIAESDLSHQAGADALPLQDAFAVLFFVSVGMVVDPRIVFERPLALVVTVLLAVGVKAAVSLGLVLARGYRVQTALFVSAGLAQVGEFSFILAALGRSLGLLPKEGQSLILAAAIVSIALNSALLRLAGSVARWLRARPQLVTRLERQRAAPAEVPAAVDGSLRDHAVIVGFGRVGGTIGRALERQGIPFLVVEIERERVESLRARGLPVLFGDATRPGILEHAALERAHMLIVAAPGSYQIREILDRGRRIKPDIDTLVRTHSVAEQRWAQSHGVGMAVIGEQELGLAMARHALRRWGVEHERVELVVEELRSSGTPFGRDAVATSSVVATNSPGQR